MPDPRRIEDGNTISFPFPPRCPRPREAPAQMLLTGYAPLETAGFASGLAGMRETAKGPQSGLRPIQRRGLRCRASACTFAQRATCSIVNTRPRSAQVAKVAISDEKWVAFRQAALMLGISVSAYLGRLVEAELKRRLGRPLATITADAPAQDQALAALSEVRASIDELEAIAGRLARSATAHGGSWKDVASSLRLTAEAAQAAHEGGPTG